MYEFIGRILHILVFKTRLRQHGTSEKSGPKIINFREFGEQIFLPEVLARIFLTFRQLYIVKVRMHCIHGFIQLAN